MRIGSLFSGYGGLDIAVQAVYGGTLAWYSEIEPAACKVLAAHHPGVPNLGDITTVDWADVPPVDILTGGYPCQPFSVAGQRKGKNDVRHLWPYVRDAISVLGPRIAVLENVAGHLSLGMGTVLGELSEIGYDARWSVVRASDAGAPHSRARVFIAAYPNGRGHGEQQESRAVAGVDRRDEGPARERQRARTLIDAGSVASAADTYGLDGSRRVGEVSGLGGGHASRADVFGVFWPAVEQWERVTGRPAPDPLVSGENRYAVEPRFVEWMMGLAAGHVTDHGLSAAQELKMLGNGVVPQQAELALRMLAVAP